MKVKLFSKPKFQYEKSRKPLDANSTYDPISGLYTNYIPGDYTEELLGEFLASQETQPNGRTVIVVSGKQRIRIDPETLIADAKVTTFRIEIV